MLDREGILAGVHHPNLVRFYRAFRRHNADGRLVEVFVIQEKVVPRKITRPVGPGELLTYLMQEGSVAGCIRRARAARDAALEAAEMHRRAGAAELARASQLKAADNEDLALALEYKARLLAFQLLRGLHALHSHVNPATGRPAGIMHRDMKPENVLCGGVDMLTLRGATVEVPRVKICDFGLARPQLDVAAGALHTRKPVSSGQYTAPEIHLGRRDFRSKVDVWSAGTTLYVILTCAFPDEPSNSTEIFLPRMQHHKWHSDRLAELGPLPSAHVAAAAQVVAEAAAAAPPAPRSDVLDLLHALLHPSDAERPTTAQALSHPWFAPVAAVVADHAGPYRDPILVRLAAAREAKGGPLAAAEAEAATRGEAAPAAPAAAAAAGGGGAAPGAGEEVVDM